jgi:hypothetical protein
MTLLLLERGKGNEVELILPRIFTSKELDRLLELCNVELEVG